MRLQTRPAINKAFLRLASENFFDDQDEKIPKLLRDFLARRFDNASFKSQKKLYLLLKLRKENEILKHLELSYSLINFWAHLALTLLGEGGGDEAGRGEAGGGEESEKKEDGGYADEKLEKALESFTEKMLAKSGTGWL